MAATTTTWFCISCQRVFEFEDCGLAALTYQLERDYGVTMRGHLLEFYAHCADCREKL